MRQAEDILLVTGLEIARLVEDVVGGKKHFGLLEDDAAFEDEGSFVGDGLPCPVMVGIDSASIADDGGERHLGGDAVEGVVIALDEGGTLEEIEGKVTADAELGKDGEVGTESLGLFRKRENTRGIAVEITHSGIELG